VVLGDGAQAVPVEDLAAVGARAGPGRDGALGDRQALVGDDEVGVELLQVAEPGAVAAGAVGGVEREDPRLELLQEGAVLRAGEALGVELVDAVVGQEGAHEALAGGEGELGRLGQARAVRLVDLHPVDDDLDVVLLVALEVAGRGLVDRLDDAVETHAGEALLLEVREQLAVLALAAAHDRRQQQRAGARVAGHEPLDDLGGRLALDRAAAHGAVRLAGAGEQQAQVVVDLGDGPDRRARVVAGRLLVDRDRGRQPSMASTSGLSMTPRNWRA
jgi:hypothetical protein